MKTLSPLPQPISSERTSTLATALKLKEGTIIHAKVTHLEGPRVVWLKVGSHLLRAQSSITLKLGQELTLQVVTTRQPLILRPALTQTGHDQVVAQALRVALPKQQSPTKLLNTLLPLSQIPAQSTEQLDRKPLTEPIPEELRRHIERLLRSLTHHPRDLFTAQGVKQALYHSGLWLEAKLATLARIQRSEAQSSSQFFGAGGKTRHEGAFPFSQSSPRVPAPPDPEVQGTDSTPTKAMARGHPLPQGSPFNPPVTPIAREQTISADQALTQPETNTLQATAETKLELELDFKVNLLRLLRLLKTIHPPSACGTHLSNERNRTQGAPAAKWFGTALREVLTRSSPIRSASDSHPVRSGSATLLFGSLPPGLHKFLLTQVEASLARLEVHQLEHRSSQELAQPHWIFELPLRQAQSTNRLRVEIERQNRGTQERDATWSVILWFDLPALGPAGATLSLSGTHLSTVLWAQEARTVQRIEDHLEALREQLHEAGFEVAYLACRQDSARREEQLMPCHTVLDEKV